MLNRLPKREDGFLLIELLSTMVILGIFFALFAQFTSMLTTRTDTIGRQAYLSSLGRAGLDRLSNELEGAMCNGATQPITQATSTSVQFTTPDRQQPFHLLQVTYSASGGNLTRQVATSTNTSTTGPPWSMGATSTAAVVVGSINNNGTAVFNYFDASGAAIAVPVSAGNLPKIARITATLTLIPSSGHGTGALTVQGGATIRTWTTQELCPS